MSSARSRASWCGKTTAVAILFGTIAVPVAGQRRHVDMLSQTFPPDARSIGMGEAVTAVAPGPYASWWNPGAFALGPRLAISPFSFSRILPGLSDDVILSSFSAGGQARGFGLGGTLNYLSYGEQDHIGDDQQWLGTFTPHEYVLRAGAGIQPLRWFMPELKEIQWGLGANLVRFRYDVGVFEPDAPPGSLEGSRWNLDLGTLLVGRLPVRDGGGSASSGHVTGRFGIVIRNLLERERIESQYVDELGRWLRVGGALEVAMFDVPPLGRAIRVTLSADGQTLDLRDQSYFSRHYGGEIGLFELLFARAGFVNDDRIDIENSSRGLGIGFDRRRLAGDRLEIGARFDWAQPPKPDWADRRANHYTLSAWAWF